MNTRKTAINGFSLVELVVVVAIIGIISMLAVGKFSGLQEKARERSNEANLARVSSALETYVAAADTDVDLNRLDALVKYDAQGGTASDTSALSSTSALMLYADQEGNVGLSADIADPAKANGYAASAAGVLGTYYLSQSEIDAIEDLGILFTMRGTDGTMSLQGDDGTWAQGDISSPDKCASVATSNRVGMAVAVVNPGATSGRTPVGTDIYTACGIRIGYTYTGKVKILNSGVECADNKAAFEELRKAGDKGGILLAYGLGENCSIIGNSLAGLEGAPVSPVMKSDEYRRYIVLIRLTYAASGKSLTAKKAEFAGVIDPRGRTLGMLRK